MAEGVNQLSHIAAEHLGDTVAEKAAIKQLTRDTVMAGGVILGGKYLSSRMASAAAQKVAQGATRGFANQAKGLSKGAGATEGFSRAGAVSSADALRLRTQLTFQEAGLLNQEGKLTESALSRSIFIDVKNGIQNQKVISQLTKDGSSIADWGKFKTQSVRAPNGQSLQIHYYRNTVTGTIDYVTPDFKVKGTVNP